MNNLYNVNSNNIKNRGENPPQKKHIDFKKIKNNTICSLNEVEWFLNNFSQFVRYIKLYKILK